MAVMVDQSVMAVVAAVVMANNFAEYNPVVES